MIKFGFIYYNLCEQVNYCLFKQVILLALLFQANGSVKYTLFSGIKGSNLKSHILKKKKKATYLPEKYICVYHKTIKIISSG